MAFGGNIGAPGSLVNPLTIRNIKGEVGLDYVDGKLRFTSESGTVYTPERVDTLFITLETGEDPSPLAALLVGLPNIANADVGALVTAGPVANQNGLPVNFGPGRGKWNGPTGQFRIRVTASEQLDVAVPAAGAGSVVCAAAPVPPGDDVVAVIRNYHAEPLETLTLIVECLHSVQG